MSNSIAEARQRMELFRDMLAESNPCPMAVSQAMLQLSVRESAAQFRRVVDEANQAYFSSASLLEFADTLDRLNDDIALIADVMHRDFHREHGLDPNTNDGLGN